MNKKCNIGENLRKAREAVNKTAVDFSNEFDIPYRTLQSYERAERTIPPSKLAQIVQKYNFNLNYIYFGNAPIFLDTQNNIEKYPSNYNKTDLKNVIIYLENYISESGILISPDKKADIIILLYQLYAKNHDLSNDIISQMCEIAK